MISSINAALKRVSRVSNGWRCLDIAKYSSDNMASSLGPVVDDGQGGQLFLSGGLLPAGGLSSTRISLLTRKVIKGAVFRSDFFFLRSYVYLVFRPTTRLVSWRL